MSDQTSDRNDRLKATMRQKETFLNSNSGAGQVPQSLNQSPRVKRPNGHVDVGTGKKS
jgi:hypothetical protein